MSWASCRPVFSDAAIQSPARRSGRRASGSVPALAIAAHTTGSVIRDRLSPAPGTRHGLVATCEAALGGGISNPP
jgi:hypothetical protein